MLLGWFLAKSCCPAGSCLGVGWFAIEGVTYRGMGGSRVNTPCSRHRGKHRGKPLASLCLRDEGREQWYSGTRGKRARIVELGLPCEGCRSGDVKELERITCTSSAPALQLESSQGRVPRVTQRRAEEEGSGVGNGEPPVPVPNSKDR